MNFEINYGALSDRELATRRARAWMLSDMEALALIDLELRRRGATPVWPAVSDEEALARAARWCSVASIARVTRNYVEVAQ